MKMKAALQSDRGFSIRTVDIEDPRPDEVLVRLAACGICHTDIMMHGSDQLLGHEGSGIVECVGSSITDIKSGDHVVISYTSCGHCLACRKRMPYKCDCLYSPFFLGYREDGTSSVSRDGAYIPTLIMQGSFAQYTVAHKSSIVKVEDSLDLKVLAPLGCGMMTGAGAIVNYLEPEKGASILICGLGAVGFGALAAARKSGCGRIIVVDRIQERLNLALEFGATDAINGDSVSDVTDAIRDICSEVDYGYDSTGSQRLLDAMEQVLKRDGKACGVGGGHLNGFGWETTDEGYSIPQIMIPEMIRWYREGVFPIDRLLKFYPFVKINEAVADIQKGKVIKPVLVMEVEK